MTAEHYIALGVEPDYANTTVGLWCPTCSLPSAVSVPLVVLSEHGVTTGAGFYLGCVNCEGEGEDDEQDLVRS